jgi:DNA repair photolyase
MKTGTREWSDFSINLFTGNCPNGCKYCYSTANNKRFKIDPEFKMKPIQRYGLTKKLAMFPTTHDLFPEHIEGILTFLTSYLSIGNEILIVTKPRSEVIKPLCMELEKYKKQILFRFTIGSMSNRVLNFWEPEAPDFEDRFISLVYAHQLGYKTSISIEPMLDMLTDDLIKFIRHSVTDTIWVGLPNNFIQRLTLNGWDEPERSRAKKLMENLNYKHVKDLYDKYKDDDMIKWKDSIRKLLNL